MALLLGITAHVLASIMIPSRIPGEHFGPVSNHYVKDVFRLYEGVLRLIRQIGQNCSTPSSRLLIHCRARIPLSLAQSLVNCLSSCER
jgi:hypothetical protein